VAVDLSYRSYRHTSPVIGAPFAIGESSRCGHTLTFDNKNAILLLSNVEASWQIAPISSKARSIS
jgi:hypothetical protein